MTRPQEVPMRRYAASIAIALIASGCSSCGEPPVCGDLEWFDLDGCPRSTLGELQVEGAWNMEVRFGGTRSAAAFSFLDPAGPTLHDHPAQLQRGPDSFLLETQFTTNGRLTRHAYAGCKAASPDEVEGPFAECTVGGGSALQGTFVAKRIRRLPGEAEAQNLTLLGEIGFAGATTADVFVSGTLAYVVLFTSGAAIVDVADPAAPKLVTRIPAIDDYWNAVWVKDQVLYLASAAEGVIFYDVATPAAPVRLGSVPDTPINVHTLFLEGNTLYAMSPAPAAETLLFDVTQARSPVLLSRFQAAGADHHASRFPHDATAFSGRLYVNHWGSGLIVADVSDPTRPSELGRFTYPYATSHASKVGAFGGRTIVFEGGEDWDAHLRVLDATDPANIEAIGAVSLRPEVSIHNLELRGQRLYVAWYQDGLRAFDVSVPASPVAIGHYNTWRETDPGRGTSFYEGAIGLRAPGDGRVYVADTSRGLLILGEPP
jgi:hypothetical protein